MKAKLGLVILLVAVLALVAGGGEAAAGAGGMATGGATGGGWFLTPRPDRHKVTFGFEAQYAGDDAYWRDAAGDDAYWRDAEGELQLVDHGSKTRIHGTFSEAHPFGLLVEFQGTCWINGTEYDFSLKAWDYGEPARKDELFIDSIEFSIGAWGDWIYHYSGTLKGGNIQVHEAE